MRQLFGGSTPRNYFVVTSAVWSSVAGASRFCGFIYAISPCNWFCSSTPFQVYFGVLPFHLLCACEPQHSGLVGALALRDQTLT